MSLSGGARLAAFEIIAPIGAGGMGEVYSARDTKLGRKVALKILPDLFAREPDRLSRFEREARLLAALNHANIATLHGLEQDGAQSFLVMELVEGDTLGDRIARGPLPVEEAIPIARQIVDALEAAHAKGIVHRDLKPANVKITPEGKVKVLDFGLAKALTSSPSQAQDLLSSPTVTANGTYAGVILGTAPYMAPEQAKGQEVDARADVFSFGCVLFEMLTGRRSFPGASVTEAIASVLAREADLTQLPANIHPGIPELLRRCLEKEPARRWQAIGDVRVELETIAQDPHGLKVAGARSQATSWRRLAVAIGATGLVVAAVTKMMVSGGQTSAQPVAPVRFAYVLPRDQSFTRTGRHVMGIARDGSALVYVANNQLYLKPLSEMAAKPVPGSNQDVNTPLFSPDGRWIAFFAVMESRLKRIAAAGGPSLTLASLNNPFGADWYADDAILVGQGPAGIVRVSASGNGKPETVITVRPGEIAQSPRMLPDGKTVLFTIVKSGATVEWDKGQVVAQTLAGGDRKVLVDNAADARYVLSGHIVYAAGNSVYAVPFDAATLQITGPPVPMVDDVARTTCCTGAGFFDVSENGTFAGIPGSVSSQRLLEFVQRNGDKKILDLPAAGYSGPRLSPDGRQIVVTVTEKDASNIWIADLAGKSAPRRVSFGGNNNFSPLWAPDGQHVVYHSDRESFGSFAVYRQAADGTGSAERLTTPAADETHKAGSWSAGGGVLAIEVTSASRGQTIWALKLEGDPKLTPLIQIPNKAAWSPSFSPDGRWIAYATDLSTRPEVYVEPYPTTGAKYLISPNGGDAPMWSHDGKELFFLGQSAATGGTAGLGTDHLMKVDIQTHTGSGFACSVPVPLPIELSTSFYDISRDDQRFLLALPPSETATGDRAPLQINVILNWFDELKRRTSKH